MQAFERLNQALEDLWETTRLMIETPVRWVLDRPLLIAGYFAICILLILVELFPR